MSDTIRATAELTTAIAPEVASNVLTESELLNSKEGEQYQSEQDEGKAADDGEEEDSKDGSSGSSSNNNNLTSSVSVESSYGSLELVRKEPPLTWSGIFWSCTINMFLPFVNGLMLGFGEIFAHELGFRWGWSAARVSINMLTLFFFF